MSDPRILTPEDVERYRHTAKLQPAVVTPYSMLRALDSIEALRAKLTEAERERDERARQVDDLQQLLDECVVASGSQSTIWRDLPAHIRRECDEARDTLAKVEAERDRLERGRLGQPVPMMGPPIPLTDRDRAELHAAVAELLLPTFSARERAIATYAAQAGFRFAKSTPGQRMADYGMKQRAEQAESRCAALERAARALYTRVNGDPWIGLTGPDEGSRDCYCVICAGRGPDIYTHASDCEWVRVIVPLLAADAPATPPATGDE